MKNVTTSVEAIAKAKIAARGTQKALSTKGLMIGDRPATFADLTTEQVNAAIRGVSFKKMTSRQVATGMLQDAIQDALLDILEGTHVWDSTKGSFYISLKMRVNALIMKKSNAKGKVTEKDSYSGVTNGDGEEVEFSYSDPSQIGADEEIDRKSAIDKFWSCLTEKETEYIKLVLEDWENEDISELMGFTTYGNFRKWKTTFKDKMFKKYNIDLEDFIKKGKKERESRSKAF